MIAGDLRGRRLVVPRGESVRPTSDRVREALFDILGPAVRDARFLDLFAGSGAAGIEAFSRGAGSVVLVDSGAESVACLQANLESLGLVSRIHLVRQPWPGALAAAALLMTASRGRDERTRPDGRGETVGGEIGEGTDPRLPLREVGHAHPGGRGQGRGFGWEPGSDGAMEGMGPGAFTIVFADPPYRDAPYAGILESLSAPGILDPSAIVVIEHEKRGGVPPRGGRLALVRIASYGRTALAFYRLDPGGLACPPTGN